MSMGYLATDPRNADVLFPYLNGEDLNSRPDGSASRWVIDFNDRSEEQAAFYELPYSQVVEQVRPERTRNADKGARDLWWRFLRPRPELRKAISGLSEVLVITRVSKTVMPIRVQTKQVFSDSMVVFACASYSDQAVLSSSLHQLWAITYGSTLETRIRYTPSDVFETFPRPEITDRLEQIGHSLSDVRHEIMIRRHLGLTKLYNLVNDRNVEAGSDRDIDHLRDIHIEIDEASIAAYGWNDVTPHHGFHAYRAAERWSLDPVSRTELLNRLLAQNHARAIREGGS